MLRAFLAAILVAVAYYGTARLSLSLALEKSNASPVWPASGLAFAAVIILGRRVWPGIMLGAFAANFVVFRANRVEPIHAVAAISLIIGLGNTLEALAGARLAGLLDWTGSRLDRASSVAKLILIAALMCALSPSIGVTAVALGGVIPWDSYPRAWFTWWLGDAIGVLLFTPFCLAWRRKLGAPWPPSRVAEGLVLFVLLYLSTRVGFGALLLPADLHFPIAFITIPFLVWSALRFSFRVTASALVLVSLTAIMSTLQGYGPYVLPTENDSLLLLQTFVGIVSVTILLMAAMVSELRETATALSFALDRAESANRAKGVFLAMVSHELRTPLTAIIGFTKVLLDKKREEKAEEPKELYLNRILNNGKNLLHLINELLDLLKIDSGGMTVVRSSVDLNALVREVLTLFELEAKARGLVLEQELPPALVPLMADPDKLRQILTNLVDNALKFTEKGKIRVAVNAESGSGRALSIDVEDTGIGIPEDQRSLIFNVFQQGESGTARRYPGAGLGLAICERLAKGMGYRIEVHPGRPQGSLFRVVLS